MLDDVVLVKKDEDWFLEWGILRGSRFKIDGDCSIWCIMFCVYKFL